MKPNRLDVLVAGLEAIQSTLHADFIKLNSDITSVLEQKPVSPEL